MVEGDPFATQRDLASAVVLELTDVGFEGVKDVGSGGFGVVYRCAQPSLDRTVAVKVLTTDLSNENRARFFREQRAMGRLTGHPNIVSILHVGTLGSGRPYLVMPYYSQDSLEARIRKTGTLGQAEAMRLGVKIAGALEAAHRVGILHRDVKPGNILFTDYGEPVLTDFGIAHVTGAFQTATGTVTGSPAYTAPEVLRGESPSAASDIYGLGATLFCAITGHAAFERRSGENVVAQFLRITTQTAPDLRDKGVLDDVGEVIERAMSANPINRPGTAAEFGERMRQIQVRNGFSVDDMALPSEPGGVRQIPPLMTVPRTSTRDLPLEMTSFVGRRRELAEAKRRLSAAHLVTLTGIGGVGKTRLGLRVAAEVRGRYSDGICLVELSELRDELLLVNVVAAALGIRDQSARPLAEVVVQHLATRKILLVLDNCEQVVDAAARLVEMLVRTCPKLTILATSREPLGIGGEVVLRVPPLPTPDPARDMSLRGMPRYDAVNLFVERAAAAVPGFQLTVENQDTVARICQQLEGLPLPIELAAARLRAMSPKQILERLTDRFKLLTLGSRGAPTRQQTLRLSVDWSYDLCTPSEQQLWARLSVFAGNFELDAAAEICGRGLAPEDLLDSLTSLVDKSIVVREECDTTVYFRLLDTLREYGRTKSEEAGEHVILRRCHRDWYQRLIVQAEAEWISSHQLAWIIRLEREQSNLREAMDFSLSEEGETAAEAGLRIAAALLPFWLSRGLFNEGRGWLDRALARQPQALTMERAKALYAGSVLAEVQGELTTADVLVEAGQVLAKQSGDSIIHARIAHAEGLLALYRGDLPRACSRLESALDVFREDHDLSMRIWILMMLGLAYQLNADASRAIACHDEVLAITEARGELVYRSYSLWAKGVATLQQGDLNGAVVALERCLGLTKRVDEPLTAAVCLEALAWIAGKQHLPDRAATLLGAAEGQAQSVGTTAIRFHNLLADHEQCIRTTRHALGARAFEAAHRHGRTMTSDEAVAYALGEQSPASAPPTATDLTRRERQVADLVAQGLSNKAIADKLVISPRTAQGHVEHVLAKLGFTSRTQIAAWVVEKNGSTR
ncbi:protein kinase [Rhodococcus sp. USK10]|uniref:protein kinase domain-containing protein n=1 Tax=Rhodococcus sp. USK10 TaxID=2789739 RepID=UPI001C5D963E|nr:protein kinase [Rhodococcus sp. USK10]QYB07111.1 protein kinase [Rhodococcus sp. USK10]